MSNAEITSDQIGYALKRISLDEYIDADQARRQNLDDARDLDLRDSQLNFFANPTDNVLVSNDRTAKTTMLLRGSVRSLRAQTLVRHETFLVPEVIDRQTVESLMYKRELAKVAIERIQVIEPSLIMQEQFRRKAYFIHSELTETHPEVDGLARILNEPDDGFLDSEEVDGKLNEIARLYLQIRREEYDHVVTTIKSIDFDTPHS